ncbi:MAG: hypothetical protein R3359_09905 [Marinirhabdus sp.]|nr:hypothetical protein [Marinirhabdus sp.]
MGKITSLLLLLCATWATAQVGINTSSPQEQFHIAGENGTLRVESLNATNNLNNGGGSGTYPLYVDENGDFTLVLEVLENTGATDAFDDTTLATNMVSLGTSDADGKAITTIKSYTFTLDQPMLLQVKYNISHHIYADASHSVIADGLARRVENYITVSPDPDPNDNLSNRNYGPSGRSYTSASSNSVTGPFYNGTTVYIKFEPTPGVPTDYTLDIMGLVSSNIRGSNSGLLSRATYIEFATDTDFLFFKLN